MPTWSGVRPAADPNPTAKRKHLRQRDRKRWRFTQLLRSAAGSTPLHDPLRATEVQPREQGIPKCNLYAPSAAQWRIVISCHLERSFLQAEAGGNGVERPLASRGRRRRGVSVRVHAPHRLRPKKKSEILRLRSLPPAPAGNCVQDDRFFWTRPTPERFYFFGAFFSTATIASYFGQNSATGTATGTERLID